MGKKINLEEILFNSKFTGLTYFEKVGVRSGIIEYTWEDKLKAMKEACRQALELAAENAVKNPMIWDHKLSKWTDESNEISKQSILDTINQIE